MLAAKTEATRARRLAFLIDASAKRRKTCHAANSGGPGNGMTQDEMDAIVMAFPGAEKGISYGRPSYKVNGKFFTRLRREDDSMVIMDVSFDEREMLMEAEPGHLPLHRPLQGLPLRAGPDRQPASGLA